MFYFTVFVRYITVQLWYDRATHSRRRRLATHTKSLRSGGTKLSVKSSEPYLRSQGSRIVARSVLAKQSPFESTFLLLWLGSNLCCVLRHSLGLSFHCFSNYHSITLKMNVVVANMERW